MSKKRYIDTNFWNDTWIETLSREEKYFFLYLITNEQTSIAGVYEISMRRMSFETEFSKVEIAQMLQKMSSKVRYINGWIVLKNAIKSQNYRNDKIKRGIKAILEQCPVDLLEYVDLPNDMDIEVERQESEPKQQRLIDDSSMSLDDPLHLIKLNRIKYNSNASSSDKPTNVAAGGSKEPSEKQKKRTYAIAMEKEREQEKRIAEAKSRPASKLSGIEMFRENKEKLKRGELKR